MRMVRFLRRLIERLRGSSAWIEANELKRRLDGGERVAIIDVRGSDEFVGPLGHIATACNIPVAELESRLGEFAGLERAPIVLVCRTDKRSATAARTLRAAGFTQVNVLRRGMEQWNETGLPVEARMITPGTRCAPLPLVGRGWGWGSFSRSPFDPHPGASRRPSPQGGG